MDYSYEMNYGLESGLFGFLFSTAGLLISLAVLIVTIIGWWKVFEKAGLAGWKSLIPFYNTYCLYRIAFGPDKGWMFLLMLVPCVNIVIDIIFSIKLARAFGKSDLFGVGLIFLNTIFVLILGFDSSRYIGEPLY